MPVLDAILDATRGRLPALDARRAELERAAARAAAPPDFSAALRGGAGLAVIAEVKRRSPSAGAINAALDPVQLAQAYTVGGAAAISVLTEPDFFSGSIDDLYAIAGAVDRPVLRKDFILDPLQILEAQAAGAAAVLLIVRALPQSQLVSLLQVAERAGLHALVEAHDAAELARAVDAGATIIGINARNLDTLTIDTTAAWALIAAVPPQCVAVAESGMASRADVEAAARAGADAVLIGAALAGAGDPRESLRTLNGVAQHGR